MAVALLIAVILLVALDWNRLVPTEPQPRNDGRIFRPPVRSR